MDRESSAMCNVSEYIKLYKFHSTSAWQIVERVWTYSRNGDCDTQLLIQWHQSVIIFIQEIKAVIMREPGGWNIQRMQMLIAREGT